MTTPETTTATDTAPKQVNLSSLLAPERVECGATAGSKKRLLENIGHLIATSEPSLTSTEIFENLIARERLGSTGIGHGTAIPHGRINGLSAPVAAFVQLGTGINFDAIDEKPVDLVFALIVPEQATDEHLNILATLAEMFNNEQFCNNLRACNSSEELMEKLTHWKP